MKSRILKLRTKKAMHPLGKLATHLRTGTRKTTFASKDYHSAAAAFAVLSEVARTENRKRGFG